MRTFYTLPESYKVSFVFSACYVIEIENDGGAYVVTAKVYDEKGALVGKHRSKRTLSECEAFADLFLPVTDRRDELMSDNTDLCHVYNKLAHTIFHYS